MPSHDHKPPRSRLRAPLLVLALLALVLISACGGALVRTDAQPAPDGLIGRLDALGTGAPNAAALEEPFGLPSAPGESDLDGGLFAEDEAIEQSLAASEARNPGDDALIVRTANLELEVEDVAASLTDARVAMTALGGYLAGSDEYDQGDRRWASVVYRVPVDRFNDAIDTLRGLSLRVNRESTQSQEVTATVVDLGARISNLRASEEALVQIMDRSGRIEDVLAVQLRLEDVRGQIERLDAQRKNLSDQAALSTLSVTWFTPVAAVTVAQAGWNLASEVDVALAQTVEALQGIASLGVWAAVVLLPLLGIPLLLLVVVLVIVRRRVRSDDGSGGSAPVTPVV